MNQYRTDYPLWGVLTVVFAVALGAAEYQYDPRDGIVVNNLAWARQGFDDFTYYAPRLVPLALGLFAVVAGAAWSSHALLVLGGFRQTRHSTEAADYDDALLADPSAASDD